LLKFAEAAAGRRTIGMEAMMDWSKVVYLNITSYYIVGRHYHGQLKQRAGTHRTVDITKILSAAEAAWLNRTGDHYTEGSETSRFTTTSELTEQAKEIWLDYFPEARVLMIGDTDIREPMKIVAHINMDTEIVAVLNSIFENCEKLGWWDKGNEQECGRLSKRWFSILSSLLS
jgi:hypothetical protein